MHTQAGKTPQRFGKMRPKRKSWKICESILRRSQSIHVALLAGALDIARDPNVAEAN